MDHTAFLSRLRGRLRSVLVLDGAARLVVIAIAVAAALIALDWAFRLPGWIRLVGLAGLGVAVALAARKRLLRPLGLSTDDRALAALAERRTPTLAGRLISRVEGLTLGAADDRVLADALSATPAVALVPAHKLPRNLALAAGVFLIALIVALAMPWLAEDGLARLLAPWSDAEWRRHSALTASLERPVVVSDEKAVVAVTRTRGPATAVTLSWTGDQGLSEDRQLAGLDGPWRHALGLPPGRWTITAGSGDALPVPLTVRVVDRAAIQRISATITPPAYAGQPAVESSTLAVSALAGSKVEFLAEFQVLPIADQRRIATAWIDLPGAERQPLTVTGATATGSFTVGLGGEVVLGGNDGDGIAAATTRMALAAVADRPPVADLRGPRNDEAVGPQAVIRLTATGGDDLALAELAIERSVRSAAETKAGSPSDLTRWTDVAGKASATRPAELSIAGLAKPGDQVVVQARASDANNVSGPGIGRSQPLTLKVVSEDELRADLARQAGDAKERIGRAREELGQGLANDQRLGAAARAAALAADKAAELLGHFQRRWAENRMPAEQAEPARLALERTAAATPQLTAAAKAESAGTAAARNADGELAEAERLLAQLVAESDLGRTLATLIAREEALAQATKSFARDYLVKPIDEEGAARRADIVKRQTELAEQVREVERRLLGDPSSSLDEAKALVRSRAPGDRLALAAKQAGSNDQRAQAPANQADALDALRKLQEKLRGNAADQALAERLGELAWREEMLQSALDAGAKPQELEAEQNRLKDDIDRASEDAKKSDPDAGKLAEAAEKSAEAAAGGMHSGDRAGASRDAGAAAALLREAQRKLAGDGDKPDDKKGKPGERDVLAVLRDLHRQQAKAVVEATALEQAHGDAPLPFAASRQATTLGQTETDLALICQEEVLARLKQFALATEAASRIQTALTAAGTHFAKPAAGGRGRRLAATALAEIARLVDIASNLPTGESKEGRGGAGAGQQPPFPPAAELALLAAMQGEVKRLTEVNRPVDLAAAQSRVRDLVETVQGQTRPGSRAQLLLTRAWRAAAQSAELLTTKDRGATTRTEQEVAELHLRQVLAEASGSNSQGSSSQSQSQQKRRESKPQPQAGQKPQPGNPEGQQSGQAQAGQAQAGSPQKGGSGERVRVAAGQEGGGLMHLPPERREQLRNAREQLHSARAQQLFERYLEVLEDGR